MSWYQKLLIGIATLVATSCNNFPKNNDQGLEDKVKIVVYQEKEVLPLPEKEDFPFPPQYRPSMSNQFKFLDAEGRYFCTGIFINPEQILTANHCLITSPEKLSIWNFIEGGYKLEDNVNSVVKDEKGDFALLNLKKRVQGMHSLQFYSGKIIPGMPVSLLTYDGLKQVLRQGKVTRVYSQESREEFITDIPAIGGNSGGVYLEPSSGRIMGIITRGSDTISLGPSKDNFKVIYRERELTPKERDIARIRQQIREAKNIMAGIDYQDFASGKVYLNASGMICQTKPFIPLVENCFPREEAENISGFRSTFTAVNGVGTLEYVVYFKDGRTYQSRQPHRDSSFKTHPGSRTLSTSITISGKQTP
jgi:hypothetical protein